MASFFFVSHTAFIFGTVFFDIASSKIDFIVPTRYLLTMFFRQVGTQTFNYYLRRKLVYIFMSLAQNSLLTSYIQEYY